jgi:hypothetical protein
MNSHIKGDGRDPEGDLLRAIAGLPVPDPGAEWAEGLPAAVLAGAARREEELLRSVAALPVPEPPPGFFEALPARVRGGIASRKVLPFTRSPWWWAGGAAAAAATVLLALQLFPSPLSQPADAEFILAVNSSSLSLGGGEDLVSAGDAGQDWLGSLDEIGLEQLEESGVYRAPVPAGWDAGDDSPAPAVRGAPEGGMDKRTSRAALVESG